MKRLLAITVAALIFAALLIPSFAEQKSGDVLKGTPILDGVLDEIYTQSATATLDSPNFYMWGDCEGTDTTGTVYYLWDENYLYVAVDVTDSTILPSVDEGVWQQDCAELWFTDEDLVFKVHASWDGDFFLGGDGDGTTAFDFDKSKHAEAKKPDGTGYIVEVALPLNNLAAGRTFDSSLQINDIITEDYQNGTASGSQTREFTYTLSAKEATPPVIETEPPETEPPAPEPAPEPEAPAPVAEPAPEAAAPAAQTGNSAAIVILAIAAAAGCAVIAKKR
ncbi:MAG: sugar-binding protein [Eubacteriales bacterium]|jgi:hypothetical protein